MLRVRLSDALPGGLLNWMNLVSSQIHSSVPLLGLVERTEGTADLLLGTPGAENFFCLRGSPKTLPLTTEIPFEVPSGLREYAKTLVAVMRQGERPARTVFGDAVAAPNSWKTTVPLLKP